MTDTNKILRPLPQRAWQVTPSSGTPSTPSTPAEPSNDDRLASQASPGRSRSILNLTSSTLYGIYQDGLESMQHSALGTPFGTGAMTPASPSSPVFGEERRFSADNRLTELPTRKAFRRRKPLYHIGRTALLFVAGLSYGIFISGLHDNPHITPVKVEGVDRNSWNYLITWGLVGAVAGNTLPLFEAFLGEEEEIQSQHLNGHAEKPSEKTKNSNLFTEWSQPLRGIGVFIGIAYAIRRLPWESSSQAALTLALVNPGLWYLIDGSSLGFIISTTLAITGTALFLGINPNLIPMPSGGIEGDLTALERIAAHGFFSAETVGIFTWLASVIFCTVICFRSIGKRLVGLQEYV